MFIFEFGLNPNKDIISPHHLFYEINIIETIFYFFIIENQIKFYIESNNNTIIK